MEVVVHLYRAFVLSLVVTVAANSAPVINPISNVTLPAGKSIIIPITATVTNGRALSYAVTVSSSGSMAVVMHTNNPFWKMNVAQACAPGTPGSFQTPYRGGVATVTNVGDMTFMLFPEYAPNTVSIIEGLTSSGFYNSNTIFERVITNFVIQGGDPLTNGFGGLVFEYNDEFNPQAIFSGNGQLAMANTGKNSNGSQFFVTVGPQRSLDFGYTLFGQLVRGFNVLSNIDNTPVDSATNNRPLADEIITQVGLIRDTSDAVITLTATNKAAITNTITVIANDGAGGLATNTFKAVSVTDTNRNYQSFIYGNTVTNLVAKVNMTLTNSIDAINMDGGTNYWIPFYMDAQSQTNSTFSGTVSNYLVRTLTYNETNIWGQMLFTIKPTNNYVGPVVMRFVVSTNQNWFNIYFSYPFLGPIPPYDMLTYTFIYGDTPIAAQAVGIPPQMPGPTTNLLLATFTNGVSGSAVTNFTASIQWGDDSITAGTIITNTAKLKEVFGAHNYTNSGVYPISITIQSSMGVTAIVTNNITIVPPLTMRRTGTNNWFAWPSWAFKYGLQSRTNVSRGTWVSLTNAPVLSGFQNVVSNSVIASQMYYRITN